MLLFLDEGYVKMYLKGRPITMYMPKDLVDTYCLEAKTDLPPKKLKLDWVYPFWCCLYNGKEIVFRLILVLNIIDSSLNEPLRYFCTENNQMI